MKGGSTMLSELDSTKSLRRPLCGVCKKKLILTANHAREPKRARRARRARWILLQWRSSSGVVNQILERAHVCTRKLALKNNQLSTRIVVRDEDIGINEPWRIIIGMPEDLGNEILVALG